MENRDKDVAIGNLPPGTRFLLPQVGITGTLIRSNLCRAHVKIDGVQDKTVTVHDKNGNEKTFVVKRTRETDWSPAVLVQVIE